MGESDKRGTLVHFLPDKTIFTVTEFNYETVATRLRELAFLNPGIKLTLTDLREKDDQGNPRSDVFFFKRRPG